MARSTLKLKALPDAVLSPVEPHKPRRGKRTIIPAKPAVAASCGRLVLAFKPPRVEYAELFAFKPQSIGERIAIVRAWMAKEGLPEIPEEVSIATFATICARFLLPRHAWPLFERRREAEAFITEWASKLLPIILDGGPAKAGKAQASWMVPEIAALYNPALLRAKYA